MKFQAKSVDPKKYIIAKYFLKSKKTLWDAAYDIAVGQSIGNPSVRSVWETDAMIERYGCKIIGEEADLRLSNYGQVSIAFPKVNLNIKEDGVSQLLCFLMGGHLDIDIIEKCHLLDVDLGFRWAKPKFGIKGIRKMTGVYHRPLLGGIVKPKTGIGPHKLLKMVKDMVEGGVNFIKEDEILGNPSFCPLTDRLRTLQPYLKGKNVVYCYCINGDFPYCLERAEQVAEAGGNGVHLNVWSGLGAYKSVRELDLPLFVHFQKSGDRAFTSSKHDHHIDWYVIAKLAAAMGVDSIHAGMWGGYSNDSEEELTRVLNVLTTGNVLPALSCGMHPGLVNKVTYMFGPDYLANVGGAIHGHPGGTLAGVKAMRQAIDEKPGKEYQEAISKWGLVS